MADVAAVVVTYNTEAWLDRCLDSLAGVETIVVDNGSTDATVALVRERGDVQLLEQENAGLAAGWNLGLQALRLVATPPDFVLILNADAWLRPGALDAMLRVAAQDARIALVGPRLLNLDGSLQRSARGFPTLWRLATEYFFLRKLAPRSQALNAFYTGGFDHASQRDVEFLMGACMLIRGSALQEVGLFDEAFFLFSEETDWCYRAHAAGWRVVFTPTAECVHVGGASHGGRLFRENLRGHLRFLDKHHGRRDAERARRLLHAAVKARALIFRGERGKQYAEAAAWLGSADVAGLLGR